MCVSAAESNALGVFPQGKPLKAPRQAALIEQHYTAPTAQAKAFALFTAYRGPFRGYNVLT
jgi:hypothetical protein